MLKQLMYALTSSTRAIGGINPHPSGPGQGDGAGAVASGGQRRGVAGADGDASAGAHHQQIASPGAISPRGTVTLAECREFAFVGEGSARVGADICSTSLLDI